MKTYNVDFEPVGRRGKCRDDESLLDCARRLGVGIISLCGGLGKSHCCKIQILGGSTSKPTASELYCFSPEEIRNGYRLACQTYIISDCKVRIPLESLSTPQRTQVEGKEIKVNRKPAVSYYRLQMSSPSLSDLQADEERIIQTLSDQFKVKCNKVDLDVSRNASPLLRSCNWKVQACLRGSELIAINSWDSHQLGLAIDLGTTKIAGYLLDLSSGQTLAARGIMNPQISYGEDVVSRLTYAMESAVNLSRLSEIVVKTFNELASNLCSQVNSNPKEIVEVVIVGNTAMHHLLLRLPVNQLALSPFVPAVRKALDVKARDLGLCVAPGAYLHLLPNIAGFVGADHVAMLLATEEKWRDKGLSIALDIGTNTEVSLIDNGEISSVSCASGPAFEGAHIKDGMRAAPGAIERVEITNEQIKYKTIGEGPPVGLCGSGIVDAIAQLYSIGIISNNGRMNEHPRVHTNGKQREFVLIEENKRSGSPAISITQKDVREVQLAKGAIRSGIEVLLQEKGHPKKEINQVIIAGAFGSYINIMSAIKIGMLPSLPLERFQQVGNAAGIGAKLALLSTDQRIKAQAMASRVSYLELGAHPHFQDIFAQTMFFS